MSENSFEKSKIYTTKASVDYAGGSIVSKILEKNQAGNITLFAFDAGQNLSTHTAPFNALVQVIEGKVKITIADTEYELGEGEMIKMPANVPHALEAITKFKMLLTMLKA